MQRYILLRILLIPHRQDSTVKAVVRDIGVDTLASLAVIAGGIFIYTIGFYRADGIAALPIAIRSR